MLLFDKLLTVYTLSVLKNSYPESIITYYVYMDTKKVVPKVLCFDLLKNTILYNMHKP